MRHKKIFAQFLRFSAIGLLNTLIDFSILNLLFLIFGLSKDGKFFILFKGISFLFAVTNSFFWNKVWVFKRTIVNTSSSSKPKKDYFFFLVISLGGLLVNAASSDRIFFIVQQIYPALSLKIAGNVAALFGTVFALLWNFIGYKFLVFKHY